MTRRLAIIAAVAVGGALLLLATLDTGPNVPLVAAIVLLACSTAWLVGHMGPALAPAAQPPPAPTTPTARADLRSTTLRQALAAGNADSRLASGIHQQLVAVIDDELRATHQINRATDPDAAAAVLGPDLHRFVDDPDVVEGVTIRKLSRIVSQIEDLTEGNHEPTDTR